MAKEYLKQGVSFVFLYTREAHPGGRYPCHVSFDQKVAHARDMAELWNVGRRVLVDDLEGTVHQAYGTLPNMTYIVGVGGVVLYRANWTDPRTIRIAVEQIEFERGQRRAGTRITPYYQEWQPQRLNDRTAFMEGLLRDVGPSAVEDFIDAVAHTDGEPAAKTIRGWWNGKQKP